ncbi:MAG: rhodanese-like domain-containing protein [Deltaproteobacteria bacterium]|jgi:rhodanese-related sulfurtransferase|nr:rhodanese-like domain-containing protein [Deltaproteobacteria bacterium]
MINYDFLFEDKQKDYQEVLRELRSGKARLIDIREHNEWEKNHFKCAMHIPLSDLVKGKGVEILKEIKKSDKKVYTHCRSGNRARKAQQVLAQYGCKEIHIIPISMMKMIEEGFILTA